MYGVTRTLNTTRSFSITSSKQIKMCGIFALLNSTLPPKELRKIALEMSGKLRHRGPDWSGICMQTYTKGEQTRSNVLAHERLAIVGLNHGAQPLFDESKTISAVANGEIYNHRELRKELCVSLFLYDSTDL
jgi:asparagine synthase (glutamine-hydrolysing)